MSSDAYRKKTTDKLTREDYRLKYFSTQIQERENRLIIKSPKQEFAGGKEEFLKLWNAGVESRQRLRVAFKREKFVIDDFRDDAAFIFSPDLAKAIGHTQPLIGRGTTWGSRDSDVTKGRASEFWYVDVYTSKLKQKEREVFIPLAVEIYPWRFQEMKHLIVYINYQVNERLKRLLLNTYDSKRHGFTLSRTDHKYCKIVLGEGLKVHLSSNLEYVFAISSSESLRKEIYGYSPIKNSLKHDQRLFLLSNIAKTTPFGEQHLKILQNFLHTGNDYLLNEKRFTPIVYLPVESKNIDMIHLQLTNENFEPVTINNSKTLVCLYFRKVR